MSAQYFNVLGLRPLLGRSFSLDEDRAHGSNVAVLSYALWHVSFHDDPGVLGRSILLKGEPYTIIGVLPAAATTPLNADVYTPLHVDRTGEGGGTNFEVITRLRASATWREADAELNRAWSQLRADFAARYPGAQVAYHTVALQTGQSAKVRPQVLVLMSVAGAILLIACANLAGLTLVRVQRSRAEMATRMALGASAWAIQRQLWAENLTLALGGGIAGWVTAYFSLRGLLSTLPAHLLPISDIPLDWRVLAFTTVLALSTSVLVGMVPSFLLRRLDVRAALADRSSSSVASYRLRQWLIAAKVALTLVLVAASGLLIRSLIHLQTLPPGFQPNGLLSAKASLDDERYRDPAAFRQLLDQSLARMREIPGVEGAAVALTLPYERALNDAVTLGDGAETGRLVGTDEVYVTPGYFQLLQTQVLRGREFTDADRSGAQPVVIVNRAFADKYFHGEDAIGHIVGHQRIVGVVADTLLSSGMTGGAPLKSEETIYLPAAQLDNRKFLAMVHTWFQPSWVVRTDNHTGTMPVRMQQALASVDPNLPFSGFYSIPELIAGTLAMQRVEVTLLSVMASLALLLSVIGIFGLVANVVALRRREVGIRLALGSSLTQVSFQVGRSGLAPSLAGLAAGMVLCGAVLRVMGNALYGVKAYDPSSLALAVTVLLLGCVAATALPAWRAAKVDPARTLREE